MWKNWPVVVVVVVAVVVVGVVVVVAVVQGGHNDSRCSQCSNLSHCHTLSMYTGQILSFNSSSFGRSIPKVPHIKV